ncbi:glycerophosphoryl diester phosphodiesterase family protein [Paenibacillus taihuensis]|uniref:Glycerophosphoryl diester phosphodiesterase family protein n=1 Tax=Paenibacillus taihuensis TaxID=1156355 RepID=A0A3D9SGA9_9BACL|nr:glycerophosphoryl diester phosphodiesterase membrane domain-containing protein [Paenibacillus taihuensis]REE90658.1 glycerophosphoryl diester phosphodiesterase family protein [Paenibacillus taihuensis]
MSNEPRLPLGISRMLKYSFQLYKQHFEKLFLLSLFYFGPIYLVMYLLMPAAMEQSSTSLNNLYHIFAGGAIDPTWQRETLDTGAFVSIVRMVLFSLFSILYVVLLGPVFAAANVFLVQAVFNREAPMSIKEAIKRAFQRFGALLGSSLLFGLIIFGIGIVTMILIGILFAIGAGGIYASGGGSVGGTVVGVVISFILIYIGVLLLWSYFVIRWMYYLPVTALREEPLGLGRSWALTRSSFWRLFGVMFVMNLIVGIFSVVVEPLFNAIIGSEGLATMLGQIVLILLRIVLFPLPVVLYAVSFFDLKVREEG